MLLGEATRHGAGVTLYGDFRDLQSLRETVHRIVDKSDFSEDIMDFVAGLAYDVRKASEREREEKTFGRDEYDRVTYRGVKLLWPVLLFQLGLLRTAAAKITISLEDRANLDRLEYSSASALSRLDEQVASYSLDWLEDFRGVSAGYCVSFLEEATERFLFPKRSGTERIQRLPAALGSLHESSGEYKQFKAMLMKASAKLGHSPYDLIYKAKRQKFQW